MIAKLFQPNIFLSYAPPCIRRGFFSESAKFYMFGYSPKKKNNKKPSHLVKVPTKGQAFFYLQNSQYSSSSVFSYVSANLQDDT